MTQLCWPNGTRTEPATSSGYGPREPIWTPEGWTRPYHVGSDWVGIGSLRAIGDGTIVENSSIGWAGWQVLIDLGVIDNQRVWFRYCHLAERSPLGVGASVRAGDVIGIEGATGQVTGKHLHGELYIGRVDRGSGGNPGSTVDPRPYIRARLSEQSNLGDDDMAYLITTDKGEILVVDHNQMTYWNVHKGIPFELVDLRMTWLKNQGAVRVVQGLQPSALLSGYREVAAPTSAGKVGTVDIDADDVAAIAKAVNDDAAKRMVS